jgi:hypothetical protein
METTGVASARREASTAIAANAETDPNAATVVIAEAEIGAVIVGVGTAVTGAGATEVGRRGNIEIKLLLAARRAFNTSPKRKRGQSATASLAIRACMFARWPTPALPTTTRISG